MRHPALLPRLIAVAATAPVALMFAQGCRRVHRLTGPEPVWVTRTVDADAPLREGGVVLIENLAGRVNVLAVPGDSVTVRALVHAGGRDKAEAEALAARLTLEVSDDPGHAWVSARYPLAKSDRYYYPEWEALGTGGDFGIVRLQMHGGHRRICKGSLGSGLGCILSGRYRNEEVAVTSRPQAGALPLYADLEISVPPGAEVKLENLIGPVMGSGLKGGFTVESVEGPVIMTGCGEDLSVTNGRGPVVIERQDGGTVEIDTGSGPVVVGRSRGRFKISGGSATVHLSEVDGEGLELETGSGDLILSRVSGPLAADTGSGTIMASGLSPRDAFSLESGSGDIFADGDLKSVREVTLESGSGNIRLGLAEPPGMDLELSTGSGEMKVDLDDLSNVTSERHEYTARYGKGGLSVKVETGSGDILVRKGSVAPPVPPVPPLPPALPRLAAPAAPPAVPAPGAVPATPAPAATPAPSAPAPSAPAAAPRSPATPVPPPPAPARKPARSH